MKLLVKEHNVAPEWKNDDDAEFLRGVVEELSFERHIHLNPEGNARAAEITFNKLKEHCDFCFYDGVHRNIVAGWGTGANLKHVIGGHYDGPPRSLGADDNASAIASICLLAKKLSDKKPQNLFLVAFNGEEEGLLGSTEFVERNRPLSGVILEMVGYFTQEPNTQTMPAGLPKFDVGDFLGIVGNRYSEGLGTKLVNLAKQIELDLPIKSLHIPLGLEDLMEGLSHTKRSDHYPFWAKRIPAVMLTDTSEFRNSNYHRMTDTPDTLNYPAMAQVVRLLESYATSLS